MGGGGYLNSTVMGIVSAVMAGGGAGFVLLLVMGLIRFSGISRLGLVKVPPRPRTHKVRFTNWQAFE